MEFAAAGALVCGLAADAGLGGRTMPRPAYGERTTTELDVATLGALLLGVANELAGSFDARNGTGHHSGRMAAWLAERPLAAPVPLPTDDGPDDPDEPDTDSSDAEIELGERELSALSSA